MTVEVILWTIICMVLGILCFALFYKCIGWFDKI